MRIALATCMNLPEADADEPFVLNALRSRGVEARMVAWDTPVHDHQSSASAFDLLVIRSTWNYYRHINAFRDWLEATAAATRLQNPIEILKWNLHKGYLHELERAGIPIVPTHFVRRNEFPDIAQIVSERGWKAIIIKPCISAASFNTRRFTCDEIDDASAFLKLLSLQGDVMIQQYLSSVEAGPEASHGGNDCGGGERSIVCFGWQHVDHGRGGGGVEPSHVIVKSRRLAGDHERVSLGRPPTHDENELARQVLQAVPLPEIANLLYARVDVMQLDDGTTVLSELELLEPSLFLKQYPPAIDRFADAILAAARTASSHPR